MKSAAVISSQTGVTQREAYLESILDRQSELVCRFLPDTTLTYVNKAYCQAFGLSKTELLGRQFIDFIPVEDRDHVLDSLNKLSAEKPAAGLPSQGDLRRRIYWMAGMDRYNHIGCN